MRSGALRLRYRKGQKQFCSACPYRRLGMPRSTVQEALRRAEPCWPLSKGMNDAASEAALYANRRSKRDYRRVEEPEWAGVHRELTQHVTLTILWDENSTRSRAATVARAFASCIAPLPGRCQSRCGRRPSLASDCSSMNAGAGVPGVIDRLTGEVRLAQIFVAVLGGSSFTFAGASWTQSLPDGIDAHLRTFEEIGGVPQILVPDNAKTAIVKSCLYDPQVNRTYADMAAHHGAALLPGRRSKRG
jgi:transposase